MIRKIGISIYEGLCEQEQCFYLIIYDADGKVVKADIDFVTGAIVGKMLHKYEFIVDRSKIASLEDLYIIIRKRLEEMNIIKNIPSQFGYEHKQSFVIPCIPVIYVPVDEKKKLYFKTYNEERLKTVIEMYSIDFCYRSARKEPNWTYITTRCNNIVDRDELESILVQVPRSEVEEFTHIISGEPEIIEKTAEVTVEFHEPELHIPNPRRRQCAKYAAWPTRSR